jgi:hypothetical protein
MDEDIEKEDAALPLVVDQARQRLSRLNYPEASLEVGGSHAIELAARATASMKASSGVDSRATESNAQEAPAACWGALTMYLRELIFSCELPCDAQRSAQSCRRRASLGLH